MGRREEKLRPTVSERSEDDGGFQPHQPVFRALIALRRAAEGDEAEREREGKDGRIVSSTFPSLESALSFEFCVGTDRLRSSESEVILLLALGFPTTAFLMCLSESREGGEGSEAKEMDGKLLFGTVMPRRLGLVVGSRFRSERSALRGWIKAEGVFEGSA